jgi:hypothetical protein
MSLHPLFAEIFAPWVGHPRQAEFEASFAAHMRAQEACTCEHDGGYGDDGSECRRTPARGCPTHAEEDAEMGVWDEDDETAALADDLARKIDDAMIEIEVRAIDQTNNACTLGEKPKK